MVLVNRGYDTPSAARRYLEASLADLSDPASLPDAREAVNRIRRAVGGEHIRVFGDYDCDGITSTALLVGVLREMGARVDYHIPSRLREGYGLSPGAIEQAASDGVDLIITVDCGISAFEEAELIRSLGMDLVITDHHEPHEILPAATAVVDPKRSDSKYPFQDLAGVGVAYCLARLLTQSELTEELDLVALGTVADAAPLIGDNRLLVRAGLQVIRETPRQAFLSMAEQAEIDLGESEAQTLAMVLGPRINAPGRLGSPSHLVDFFLTTEPARAQRIAAACERANEERRDIQGEVIADVERLAAADPKLESRAFWLLWSEDWHSGVLGPAASRVAELYRRPVALLAPGPDDPNMFRGSARSVPGFDLFDALYSCSDLLHDYGGHVAAAGLGTPRDRLEQLARRLHELAARRLTPDKIIPRLPIVGELPLGSVDLEATRQLASLGPFGFGNPKPVFLSRDVPIERARPAGEGEKHLILDLAGRGLQAIGFGLGSLWKSFDERGRMDLAFFLEVDRWRGRERVRLRLESLRPADRGSEASLLAALRGRYREVASRTPGVDAVGEVLEYLREIASGPGTFFDPRGEEAKRLCEELGVDEASLEEALAILEDAGAVAPMRRGESRLWLVLPGAEEPLELGNTLRYRQKRELLEKLRRAGANVGKLTAAEIAYLLYGFHPADAPGDDCVSDAVGKGKIPDQGVRS
ncbi:MAG: single-stranded-DNA-specific exonuclease RecJ [Bacillota bacterium]